MLYIVILFISATITSSTSVSLQQVGGNTTVSSGDGPPTTTSPPEVKTTTAAAADVTPTGGGDVSTTTTTTSTAATTSATALATTSATTSLTDKPTQPPGPATDETNTTSTTTAIPPLTSVGPRKCGNAEDTDICYYENSREPCDICEGVMCPVGKKCVKRDQICVADCVCERDTDVVDEDGTCRNPCYRNQCQNGGSCVVDANRLSKFRCDCLEEFDGELCENMHNFCLDPKPSFCPAGQYNCQMLGFRNYTCECAEGFVYDLSGKTCVKVGEVVNITLVFKETYYSELYNNVTHPEAIEARRTITAAFTKIYGDHLIRLVFDNFTQGSLVANMKLMLKLDDSGAFRSNERIFKQFLLDCDTQNKACFGTLGKAYLPYDGWAAKDERCGNVICPQHTVCEPIDGQPGKTQCVCMGGFEATGSTVDDQGRLIQLCEDINECELNPCPTIEECQNTPGNYTCTHDTTIATCPSGSKIVVTGPFSYRCECSWIYAGSDCRFPLTLILLILACFFLLTTLIAGVFMYLQKKRNRSGTYQLYSVPDGMSSIKSVKTVESSWT